MMSEERNWMFLLASHRAGNLTFTRFQKVKNFFHGDWEHFWESSEKELMESGLDIRGIESFISARTNISPQKEWERLKKCDAKMLVYGEEEYPYSLKNIPSPPAILFIRGEILASDTPSISVVGSRKLSSYGARAIETLVGKIAQKGITIVSGLALGADVCAHRTALEHGARTIAILGSGIDCITPSSNRMVGEKIWKEKKGAIISEYLPNTESRPEFFPIRNRIIAGMSCATIVIEAEKASGSLITAGMALEQGREVFAVPGEIFAPNSRGTNQLILSGHAHPALSAEQILEPLGLGKKQKNVSENTPQSLSEIETEILELFGQESRMHVNDLIKNSSLPSHMVSANLSLMEIKGLVRDLGNQMYAKNV